MTTSVFAAMVVMLTVSAVAGYTQALPPPRDGDIRVLHYALPNLTAVWLTLEPKGTDGKPLPIITLTFQFAGKRPKARPTEVEMRAYAGLLWVPRQELWMVLDNGRKIDVVPQAFAGQGLVFNEFGPTSFVATVSIETLRQVAVSKGAVGNTLGFPFELSRFQCWTIGEFLDRILSDNPGRFP